VPETTSLPDRADDRPSAPDRPVRVTTSSGRPWRRGAVVLVASFLLGGLTSYAQGFLPDAAAPFANSASGWTLLTALLVARLVQCGLARRYPLFTFWLSIAVLRGVIILSVPFEPRTYARFYEASEILNWCLLAAALLEVYRVAFARLRSIHTTGRHLVSGVLLAAPAAALILFFWQRSHSRFETFFLLGTGIHAGLGVGVLLIAVLLTWFPVPVSRNAAIHTTIFSVYFLSKAAAFLSQALLDSKPSRGLSIAIMVLGGSCIAAWTALLRPVGEAVVLREQPTWSAAEEDRLLQEVNSLLTLASRASADAGKLFSADHVEDPRSTDLASQKDRSRSVR